MSEMRARALTAIAYFQPLTRTKLRQILCRDISRDSLATLRETGLIAAGPRSPRAGAPVTYVTTGTFLERFGLASLRDLPDTENSRTRGLPGKEGLLSGELASAFGSDAEEPDEIE